MENKKLDLIDRNALYEKAYFSGKLPDPGNLYPEGKEVVDVDDIENAPAVDAVEVVHGRWIAVEDREYLGVMCSNCQKWFDEKTNYCPNCGSKMNGDLNGK